MTVVWMIGRTPCPNALRKSPQNLLTAASAQAQISLSTVTIGNAGNAADSTTGYGAVGYSYNIGTTEVTLTQYTAFLNAVAATDTYGLYRALQYEPGDGPEHQGHRPERKQRSLQLCGERERGAASDVCELV